MELLTYTEAAELTGLTNKTLQRHVKKGALEAIETPVGKRIPRSALEPYMGLRRDSRGQAEGEPDEDTETLQGQVFEDVEDVPETTRDSEAQTIPRSPSEGSTVPLAAHLAALELARTQLEYLQRQAEDSQRIALQAERAKYSLEAQLSQYQRVLAESAESLAEERAMRLVAEAHASQLAANESKTEALEESTPAASGLVATIAASPSKRRGWGNRLRVWLLGEKAG